MDVNQASFPMTFGVCPEPMPVESVPQTLQSADVKSFEPSQPTAKIVFDFVVAALLIAVSSPLMLLIALLVCFDGGPVFFAHERIGRAGKRFPCLKFRTMVTNSDAVLHELLRRDASAAGEWAETQKLKKDPRVTWVGSWLRKTSLDELPQLINVIVGQMSLVGPRPIVQHEIQRYADDVVYYYSVRPGLTGLWQISGRSEISYERRVQLDVTYVQNWSVRQDLLILIKTLPAVLVRRGAY